MPESANERWAESRLLILGGLWMLAGIMVYVFARPAGSAAFLPRALQLNLAPPGLHFLTGRLPTFAHVIALSLISVWALNPLKKGAAAICAGWMLIETGFEAGQQAQVSAWLVPRFPDFFSHVWLLDKLAGYLTRGTFDPGDVAAAALGAATAFLITVKSTSLKEAK